jgi:hypothetical protein
MEYVRVTIGVWGFTQEEIDRGLSHLVDEFTHRPWLMNPCAVWNTARNRMIVTVDYEGQDAKLCGKAVLDEIGDCVIACFDCSSTMHFEIEGTMLSQAS